MEDWRKAIRAALPTTVPVMMGYFVLGAAYGILMNQRGCSVFVVFLSSWFIYAGSLQYVQLDVITQAFSPIATALMALVVNARHVAYGISMVERYQKFGWKKWLLAGELTDETFALVSSAEVPEGIDPYKFYQSISILDHIYWTGASCVGALLGKMITFDTTGMDFVLTALFVSIFVEQSLNNKEHRPAILGLAIPYVCLLLIPDQFIIVSLILLVGTLLILRKKLEGTNHE